MAKSTTRAASGKNAIAHVLTVGRPERGGALFAHTFAFLEQSGMLDMSKMSAGQPVARAIVSKAIGASALNHHVNKGTLAKGPDGVTLTQDGVTHFAGRGATDAELIGEFQTMFASGKIGTKLAAALPKGAKTAPVA